jgi:hypothetical protein
MAEWGRFTRRKNGYVVSAPTVTPVSSSLAAQHGLLARREAFDKERS